MFYDRYHLILQQNIRRVECACVFECVRVRVHVPDEKFYYTWSFNKFILYSYKIKKNKFIKLVNCNEQGYSDI